MSYVKSYKCWQDKTNLFKRGSDSSLATGYNAQLQLIVRFIAEILGDYLKKDQLV